MVLRVHATRRYMLVDLLCGGTYALEIEVLRARACQNIAQWTLRVTDKVVSSITVQDED